MADQVMPTTSDALSVVGQFPGAYGPAQAPQQLRPDQLQATAAATARAALETNQRLMNQPSYYAGKVNNQNIYRYFSNNNVAPNAGQAPTGPGYAPSSIGPSGYGASGSSTPQGDNPGAVTSQGAPDPLGTQFNLAPAGLGGRSVWQASGPGSWARASSVQTPGMVSTVDQTGRQSFVPGANYGRVGASPPSASMGPSSSMPVTPSAVSSRAGTTSGSGGIGPQARGISFGNFSLPQPPGIGTFCPAWAMAAWNVLNALVNCTVQIVPSATAQGGLGAFVMGGGGVQAILKLFINAAQVGGLGPLATMQQAQLFSGVITTAKITTATGSMTFVNGVLVSQVQAT